MSLNDYKTIGLIYSNDYGQIEKVKYEENNSIFIMKRTNKKNLKYKNENQTINEIEKLSSINHQNLAEYKTFFFDKNNFYLLMEYDDESYLREKIEYNLKNHLSFEESYLWSLTIQLLNLLKFIQENEEIDFNFTSINILLMNNGTLKVFDYAKNYKKLIYNEDSWIMDIYTLPPEILKDSKNIDRNAANIWKAGCIIYELCTLNLPFEGNNAKEIAMKILEGKYEPIGSKYSNDFNILISKMLVLNPKKRATASELLNNDIIKKRKVEIDDTKTNTNLFTFKKPNFKETLRQKQSQREMMENDKYEIMKFTLSKNNLENNENIESTGHFNFNDKFSFMNINEFNDFDDFKQRIIDENKKKGLNENNNEDDLNQRIIEENERKNINENNNDDDFNRKIIEENKNKNINENNNEGDFNKIIIKENKKKGIIENNNFNYNNPYRNNNINIKKKNNENNIPKLNKNNKNNNNNNINIFNKKHQRIECKNKPKNKPNNKFILKNDNDNLNQIKNERQKTPNATTKKNNFFEEINDNKKIFNNNYNKNKKLFLAFPKDNKNNLNSNIKVIKSNEIKPSSNLKNNIKEKTEQILNSLNKNKNEDNKIKLKAKIIKKGTNDINNDKKNKFPMLSKMYNYPKENYADKIINQILNKNNNNKKLQTKNMNNNNNKNNFIFNYENNNLNQNIMNNNFKLKNNSINPVIKPSNNLPSFTYGKNNQIKIEYGVVKFNSHNIHRQKKK